LISAIKKSSFCHHINSQKTHNQQSSSKKEKSLQSGTIREIFIFLNSLFRISRWRPRQLFPIFPVTFVTMKHFLRIFCLYLFALTCIPCNDGNHGHEATPGSGETAGHTDKHNRPTHEHCADFCSPFCTCACCGCVTASEKIAALELCPPLLNIPEAAFTYQSPFTVAHHRALFRPPISRLG
jgi:hypothetical protein